MESPGDVRRREARRNLIFRGGLTLFGAAVLAPVVLPGIAEALKKFAEGEINPMYGKFIEVGEDGQPIPRQGFLASIAEKTIPIRELPHPSARIAIELSPNKENDKPYEMYRVGGGTYESRDNRGSRTVVVDGRKVIYGEWFKIESGFVSANFVTLLPRK